VLNIKKGNNKKALKIPAISKDVFCLSLSKKH
jgi:hypothetical protein